MAVVEGRTGRSGIGGIGHGGIQSGGQGSPGEQSSSVPAPGSSQWRLHFLQFLFSEKPPLSNSPFEPWPLDEPTAVAADPRAPVKITVMRIVFYSLLMLIAVAPAGAQRPAEDAFSSARARQPKTVREFFNLLPQKYFMLEGCAAKPTKKNCDTVRAEYLKNYLEVEDIANGYMRGGCDGAQSCFHMALFRRPDGTYVVGLTTAFELGENSYFLEYTGGRWHDVGPQVVPGYGEDKVYELPRYGTTVEVYENKRVTGEDYRERGRKLYKLAWKNGAFTIER